MIIGKNRRQEDVCRDQQYAGQDHFAALEPADSKETTYGSGQQIKQLGKIHGPGP